MIKLAEYLAALLALLLLCCAQISIRDQIDWHDGSSGGFISRPQY